MDPLIPLRTYDVGDIKSRVIGETRAEGGCEIEVKCIPDSHPFRLQRVEREREIEMEGRVDWRHQNYMDAKRGEREEDDQKE